MADIYSNSHTPGHFDVQQNAEMPIGYNGLPYDDPAILNPDELATFPKQVRRDGYHHHDHHHHHHHMKSTPVRDGRNITRTDNHPDKHGFM